ncbi:protogenin B-like [Haliotis asinina]|uniref:protogenin B-like n=1 Tax=Haliotis asinina TaxID=109174 RepID=UPI003531C835
MDLSITPVVLPLLFVGFSYAQELVLNPDTTIVINSRSKGLVINCEVVGMGIGQRANVQWLDTKGNVIGPYSNMRTPRIYSNQMGNRNSLQFVTLVNSDAGRYTCRGTIGSKIMTKQIQLSLNTNGLPSIKVPPTWSTPVVGKRFELTCLADGRPQPSFIFDKDKFVLSGDRYNVSVTKGVNGSQGVLVIEDFHYTDQGNYSCIAYNQVGHESRTVVISTVVPPVIEPILNISEPEGNAAELVCAARGNPSPVVTWKVKDSDIPITDSQDITIEYTHKEDPLMHFITVKLKFARLERNHTNNYTCSASNVGGTDEKEGRIAVEFKPNFADSPYSSAYGWVNHKTEIKCVANAVPPPVLFWEHNNAMVIRGPFFGISSTQENQQTISTLEVLVTVENKNTIFGNYKCVARNYLGSSEKDIVLKHAAVPSAPGVSIVAVSPTTISLLATADMTGLQPIEAYKVMFYAEGDDQNQVSQLVPVNITSQGMPTEFVINNLTPSRRYFISVNARNNLGYGAKAEISAMTRAIRQPSRPKVTSPRSSDDPNSYKLVWEKPGTGGMPLTGYVVKYYQVELSDGHTDQVKAVVGDIKLLQIGQGNVTEIMLTDLIPNSTYELQISAMNAIGKSAAASKIFTTPSEESMPPAPDVSVAAVSPTSISLLMMADMTGGQPIEAYRVIFYAEGDDQNQVSQLVPVNTTSKGKQTRFVINNLIPSRRYVINVDARNNMGYTARTAISTMTQDIRQPNPPKVTSPRSSDDPNSYKLVWEKPGTGGMPLTGYVVKYYQVKLSEDHPGEVKAVVGDIKTISIYRSNVTEITLFGLKPNCTYELQISATNAKGMSMPTNKIFTTPPGGSKPSAPSISADEVTSSSIRLLIAKEQETGGLPIIAYRIVYYAKGNVKGKIRRKIPVNTNSEDVQTVFLIDNLEAGVQYFIRVTARNNLGYGAKARMSVRTPFFTVTSPTSLSFASTFVYFTEGDDESKVTRMTPVKPPSQTSPIRPYNLNVNNVGYWTKDVLRVTTPSVRQPDPPAVTSPRSSDHPNSYKLAWEKPETGGKPLTGYKVKYYQVCILSPSSPKVASTRSSDHPNSYKLAWEKPETGGKPLTGYKVKYYQVCILSPSSPKVTSTRSSDHPNSYKLAWEKPETGGKPLTGYKVKYYQVCILSPSSPKVTSTRSSDHPNSYKLAWEKPETGGKPLTGYKVKYYQVEVYEDAPDKVKAVVGDKKSLMINQGDTTEMRLPNLEPSSTYELQIIAINEIGESMATKKIFSTPSDRH